jgi:SAM-dependent methyltransferase
MIVPLAERGAIATGINIVGKAKEFGPNARLEIRDIRNSEFESDTFDFILSYAAFEHVGDFDVALGEMRRILKPGGKLMSRFGPIWSCKWGHHLWLNIRGTAYTYQNTLLPPYCHLIMAEDEIADAAFKIIGKKEAAEAVAKWVLYSPEQNRVMCGDYRRIVDASGFEVEEFRPQPGKMLDAKYAPTTPAQIEKLYAKFGSDENFEAANITFILRK